MTDLTRDALQELFDSRFPEGARIEIWTPEPPFGSEWLTTPRVAVLSDGYLMFDLPTTAAQMTVAELEVTDDSVVVKNSHGNFYRFSAPTAVQRTELLKERVGWSDERLAAERDWHDEWNRLSA